MGLRDKLIDAAIRHSTEADGTPAVARRATQIASVAAHMASGHSTVAAVGIASLGAAAVAAESAMTTFVYPPGNYATFDED